MKNLCMVIGDPVSHSLSPDLHNAGYKKLGIDSEFAYEARPVKAEGLPGFINSIRSSNVRGVSVTKPHKEAIIPLLDKITDEAKTIGAVNTVVVNDGKLTGHNTDWLGAVLSLKNVTDLKGKKVVLVGAGGTAKAFAYGLSRESCEVTVLNRTMEKAEKLSRKYSFGYGPLNDMDSIKNADIICNTTIADNVIAAELISSKQIVFDVVYSSAGTSLLKTDLLIKAEGKGATIISAIEMLLYQGFAQFKLFTGRSAPEKYIRDIIMQKVMNER